ncbi:hypothetical protein [Nocardia sp. XZ_19_231]|uniref:hypothetical protein n=1 Tax=Nocardia sp. XZ_19_231 TaxID=2769252 RepID=UPI00188F6B7D|nr:hypothetical protein [Nocardia sp. XZ_19_231]
MSSYLDDYHDALAAAGDLDALRSPADPAEPVSELERLRAWRAARVAERVEIDGRLVHPDAVHGTASGYSVYSCRCEECTTAKVVSNAEAVDRARARESGHGIARWRRGCRCVLCADAHNLAERRRRRRRARRAFDPYLRKRFLDALAQGGNPMSVAVQFEVTWAQALALAKYDRRWGPRLDAALLAGRNPEIAHGTYHSYQRHRCRCPECRAAKGRYR